MLLEIAEFLSEDEIEALEILTFTREEYIYTSTERIRVGYVLSGGVKILKNSLDKEYLSSEKFVAGSFVGLNLYLHGALEGVGLDFLADSDDTRIIFFTRECVEKLLKNPRFIRRVMDESYRALANETKALGTAFLYGPLGHFAYILDTTQCKSMVHFERFLDYCNYLNINKTRLYEISNKLSRDGAIKKEKNYIKILDNKKLRSYFGE